MEFINLFHIWEVQMRSRDKKMIIKKMGSCQSCGFSEYPEILTIHHIFKKENYERQPPFKRYLRCVVLCPNCHFLIERGIMNDHIKNIVTDKLKECERIYGPQECIDNELMKFGVWEENVK